MSWGALLAMLYLVGIELLQGRGKLGDTGLDRDMLCTWRKLFLTCGGSPLCCVMYGYERRQLLGRLYYSFMIESINVY
jgi:hypothetical protein